MRTQTQEFFVLKRKTKIEKNYITKSTSYYYNVKNLRRKIIVFNSDDEEKKEDFEKINMKKTDKKQSNFM